MEEGKIEVPFYLGLKIQKRLKEKYGIETDGIHYSREDLRKIDKLEIVPPLEGGLQKIDLLLNLESLVVTSVGNTAFQTKLVPSIMDDDINSIAKCTKLKELSIINQVKIDCLDCSRFARFNKPYDKK